MWNHTLVTTPLQICLIWCQWMEILGVGMQGMHAMNSDDKNALNSGHDFNLNYVRCK